MVKSLHSHRGVAALALAAALGCLVTSARAADLDLRGPLPAPLPEAVVQPVYDWTGFHIGVEGGWARAGKQTALTTGSNPSEQFLVDAGGIGAIGFSQSGTAIGGGIGYDVQPFAGSGFVLGVAADALATDLAPTRTAAFSVAGNAIDVSAAQRLDWLGTVRGRLGYGFSNVLVYGTGGFAYGGVSARARVDLTNAFYSGIYDSGRFDGIETGYAYGGGVEFGLPAGLMPFADRVSMKVEYLRYDLGTRNVQLTGQGPVFGPDGLTPVGHTGDTRFRTQGQLLKAGLNVKLY